MNRASSQVYIPWHFPSLQLGVLPEQASLFPHLHTPVVVSQVSVAPEQPESFVHLSIELKLKYNYIGNMIE